MSSTRPNLASWTLPQVAPAANICAVARWARSGKSDGGSGHINLTQLPRGMPSVRGGKRARPCPQASKARAQVLDGFGQEVYVALRRGAKDEVESQHASSLEHVLGEEANGPEGPQGLPPRSASRVIGRRGGTQ